MKKNVLLFVLFVLGMGVVARADHSKRWDDCTKRDLCQVIAPCTFESWTPDPNVSSDPNDPVYTKEPLYRLLYISTKSYRLVTQMKLYDESCAYTLQRK